MIIRAATVVTMDGAPISNGAVAIENERIVEVGTFEDVRRSHSAEVLDLGERILLPGLINAHCHLDYTGLRGKIASTDSFTAWIRSINAQKERLSPAAYAEAIRVGIAEAADFGTTSLISFEAFPNLASEIKSAIRIWWLGELIDVRSPEKAQTMVSSAINALKNLAHWGLAPHAPFTASGPLYRESEQVTAREHRLLSTHLAESREEMQMFRDATGPLYQFLKSIGRNMDDCGRETPVAHFLSMVSAPNHWIVAHLNEIAGSDFELLERVQPKFSIVHCPRSHQYFGHARFAFDQLRQLGFNICLGTDSLASVDSLDLFREMQTFSDKYPSVASEDIVQMVTTNPARAVCCEDSLGRIRAGCYADLIAINRDDARNAFEAIINQTGPVAWAMISGKPLE
jgi:cytosine/adenosine deaminase-related metal-dependent hydrolase